MEDSLYEDVVSEPVSSLTYGMSETLLSSGLLSKVRCLSHKDKMCLIRYIYRTDDAEAKTFDNLHDDLPPYTMEELTARIDEAEEGIDRGEGKSFEEMMNGFRKELLWLK